MPWVARSVRSILYFSSALRFSSAPASFAGNELIAALLRQLIRNVQELVKVVAEQYLATRSLDLGDAIQRAGKIRAQLRYLGTGFLEERPRGAALLIEQRRHEMHGLDVLIVAADGERLGIGQCRLEFGRQLVHSHRNSLEITL